MALRTAFTRQMSVRHPIASAPMGGVAGGALAAAVSEAGGLGLIGGGTGARDRIEPELRVAQSATDKPWGIGFLSWGVDVETVTWALKFEPAAVLLSFGDPTPLVEPIRESGANLIIQVTGLQEAHRAVEVGADVLVAQGWDAGGHGGEDAVGTLSFVPSVVDIAGGTPVLAAGGIVDGRGLAAVLALGAAGALIGTRFEATQEASVSAAETEALLAAGVQDTLRNRTLDIARGARWPARYPARTLRTEFLDRWSGRDDELRRDPAALDAYRDLASRADPAALAVWAGQGVGQVTAIEPAGDVVAEVAAAAENGLARLAASGQ